MTPKEALYNHLVAYGLAPEEAMLLAAGDDLQQGTYNDLPWGTYTGEVIGGVGAESFVSALPQYQDRARLKELMLQRKPLPKNPVRRKVTKAWRRFVPGAPKALAGIGGAIAGGLAGESITGEDFWDEATSGEALSSAGGSLIGTGLGALAATAGLASAPISIPLLTILGGVLGPEIYQQLTDDKDSAKGRVERMV
jgi:hypothetical protein